MKKCLPCPCHMGSQVWDTEYSWDTAACVSQPFLKKIFGYGRDMAQIRLGYGRDIVGTRARKK